MKQESKLKKRVVLKYVLVILLLSIIILPFYWIFISSVKPTDELIRAIPTFIPEKWTFSHYSRLFAASDYGQYLWNSFYVAFWSMVITVILASLGGYSIYRCSYPGKNFISKLILVTYIFPQVLILIPLYKVMSRFYLINNLWSLIIINVTICAPFGVWLLRTFFGTIPMAIEEAAAIDGASQLKTLYKIFIPLAAPGMATVAIYAFLTSWTEFLFANVFIIDEELKTLPVGLARFITQYNVDWGLLNAGAMVTAIPPLIFFAFVGKYFIKGLTAGSIK
ncbi:MAG: multiple sugar transport system permease protein [Halanaerobiales bacterium]|nr:multiple sugar transport system permease protein [Halanaerobiales bacterium]